MKKVILTFLFIFLSLTKLTSQSTESYSGAHQLHLSAGYGTYNLSLAGGYKYTFGNLPISIGGTLGIAGFTTDIPNYGHSNGSGVNIYNLDEVKYPTFLISGDLDLYYEWKEFAFYGSVGFYSLSDTVLAKEVKETYTNYYYKKTESSSGLGLGAGIQYYFKDDMTFGLGFHTKRGLYLQFGYCWY